MQAQHHHRRLPPGRPGSRPGWWSGGGPHDMMPGVLVLLVGIAGAVGAVCRYGLGVAVGLIGPSGSPWVTPGVKVTGVFPAGIPRGGRARPRQRRPGRDRDRLARGVHHLSPRSAPTPSPWPETASSPSPARTSWPPSYSVSPARPLACSWATSPDSAFRPWPEFEGPGRGLPHRHRWSTSRARPGTGPGPLPGP
jgi:hypothetical protein